MNVEAWRKNENTSSFDRLVKGTLLTVEGYFKPEEWQDADGVKHNRVVLVAAKFYEAVEKEDTPAPLEHQSAGPSSSGQPHYAKWGTCRSRLVCKAYIYRRERHVETKRCHPSSLRYTQCQQSHLTCRYYNQS